MAAKSEVWVCVADFLNSLAAWEHCKEAQERYAGAEEENTSWPYKIYKNDLKSSTSKSTHTCTTEEVQKGLASCGFIRLYNEFCKTYRGCAVNTNTEKIEGHSAVEHWYRLC